MGAESASGAGPRRRRRSGPQTVPPEPRSDASPGKIPAKPAPTVPAVPTVLDFYPLEEPKYTGLHAFFENLRAGRFTTTRCRRDGRLLWPPRLVCPACHTSELEWVELPRRGRIYAFSAILAGAPLGMEAEVPFSVGLIDLEGAPLRLFGRIEGAPWDRLRVGLPVRVEPVELPDGRIFYRFHVDEPGPAR